MRGGPPGNLRGTIDTGRSPRCTRAPARRSRHRRSRRRGRRSSSIVGTWRGRPRHRLSESCLRPAWRHRYSRREPSTPPRREWMRALAWTGAQRTPWPHGCLRCERRRWLRVARNGASRTARGLAWRDSTSCGRAGVSTGRGTTTSVDREHRLDAAESPESMPGIDWTRSNRRVRSRPSKGSDGTRGIDAASGLHRRDPARSTRWCA